MMEKTREVQINYKKRRSDSIYLSVEELPLNHEEVIDALNQLGDYLEGSKPFDVLQARLKSNRFYVTLNNVENFRKAIELEYIKASNGKVVYIKPVFGQQKVVIKHLPSWIPDEVVIKFCNEYGIVKKVIHPKNRNDYWGKYSIDTENGDRWVYMTVKKEIPMFTEIENARVFIKHEGQGPSCGFCRAVGHIYEDCTARNRCKNCESVEHKTEDCNPEKCFYCNDLITHEDEDCPIKRQDWEGENIETEGPNETNSTLSDVSTEEAETTCGNFSDCSLNESQCRVISEEANVPHNASITTVMNSYDTAMKKVLERNEGKQVEISKKKKRGRRKK